MPSANDRTVKTDNLHTIYLAGGCFWGLEAFLKQLPGVRGTEVGYANGATCNPTYAEVCHGGTGHAETVKVTYDPQVLPTDVLLRGFFSVIDPTSVNRQGNDVGTQYRSGVYWDDPTDEAVVRTALAELQTSYRGPVATEVGPIRGFYPAEDYHQDYLDKNPGGYCHIRPGAARSFVEQSGLVEGRPYRGGCAHTAGDASADRTSLGAAIAARGYRASSDDDLQASLSHEQYRVVRHGGTERPFSSPHDRRFEPGIYVDVTSGEPLFSSADKFDAGCGWPSFSRPIAPGVVGERLDLSHGMVRTEVRSSAGKAHLGHVFDDGPAELGGRRYCINGAALRFVPRDSMEAQGYGYLLPFVEG